MSQRLNKTQDLGVGSLREKSDKAIERSKQKMIFRFVVTDGEDTKIDVSSPDPALVKRLLDVWIEEKMVL